MNERLEKHQLDYKPIIWKQYSLMELGNWVHNFHKRAFHRTNQEKAKKDLYDAKNYWIMMGEMLKERAKELKLDWEKL